MSDKTTPPDFRKGDMRRVWFILGAVATQDQPTLTTLVRETGMAKASVNDLLNKVMDGQIPTLQMTKQGTVYVVEDWGDLVNKSSVISFFNTCKVGLSDACLPQVNQIIAGEG